jgi:large repetitive protein
MRRAGAHDLRPLSRSRGMPAAAVLGIGVVAAYVVLGALAVTSFGPAVVVGVESGLHRVAGVIPFHQPHARDYAAATPGGARVASAAGGAVAIDFGRLSTGTAVADAIRVTNTSARPLDMRLTVIGAPGVSATFAASGSAALRVAGGRAASVSVASNPLRAGAIAGTLRVDLGNGLHLDVPLRGAQAPLAPGPVTATAAAGGAVRLSWAASPSSGVAGYAVFRLAGSGAWTRVGPLTHGTSLTDRTGADGATLDYRVQAAAAGVSPELLGPAGPTATVTTDATPPAAPLDIVVPPIAQDNASAVPVEVDLPDSSTAAETVAVTLSDGSHTVTASAPGGVAAAKVTLDASALADGPVAVSVTVADAAGNVTRTSAATTKDTAAPAPPAAVSAQAINADDERAVPVTFTAPADAAPTDNVRVELEAGGQTARATAPAGAGTVTVDASALPDGPVGVTAWSVDAAGNVSAPVAGPDVVKDVAPPGVPASLGVAAGPANPAGYVNTASQAAVSVSAQFSSPLDPADAVTLTVAGDQVPVSVSGDTVTAAGIDLRAAPDGPVALVLSVTDAAGNTSRTEATATKDTVAPQAPDSFGVPAGDANPAGYVNAATQRSATVVAAFAGEDSGGSVTASADGIDLGTRPGGGEVAFTADLARLPDGPVALSGTATDAAGNATAFTGSLQKDTVAPQAPTSAEVVSDPPGTISQADAACVVVRVAFAQPDAGGMVTMTLADEGATSATVSAPSGAASADLPCIDASALPAGDVHLQGTVSDAAGNVTAFAGTTATKLP